MKKVRLKDAFVKNTPPPGSQLTSDTAIQSAKPPVATQAASFVGEGNSSAAVPKKPAIHLHGDAIIQSSVPAGPQKKKATFNLDARLHQRLKVIAAMHSREMVDIVEDALQKYLQTMDQKAG